MPKKPIVKVRMKIRFDYKKFLNNWNGFDSFFSYIGGVLTLASIVLFTSYTTSQVLAYIKPFAMPIILLVVFAYCMNKAFFVMKERKQPLNPKTMAEGFWGNFISVGWMSGGLFFIASNSPEIWRVVTVYLEK